MKVLYNRRNEVDWKEIIDLLEHEWAVKFYFDDLMETLTVRYISRNLLIQNSITKEVVIDNLAQRNMNLCVYVLKRALEQELLENDLDYVDLIEKVNFNLALVSIPD